MIPRKFRFGDNLVPKDARASNPEFHFTLESDDQIVFDNRHNEWYYLTQAGIGFYEHELEAESVYVVD